MPEATAAQCTFQKFLGAANLPCTRQKHQRVAFIFFQGILHGIGNHRRQRAFRIAARITQVHRETPAFAYDHRGIPEQLRHCGAVQRRGHHKDFQIRPQVAPAVERQRQRQVGVQVALMKFIENHQPHAFKRGVRLQPTRENPLGQHFNARCLRHLGIEADAIAHGFANGFVAQHAHARGGGARREPSRLQHQDRAPGEPRLIEQRQRHQCGLARARRRLQHHRPNAPPAPCAAAGGLLRWAKT